MKRICEEEFLRVGDIVQALNLSCGVNLKNNMNLGGKIWRWRVERQFTVVDEQRVSHYVVMND
jgi:hypothetical protein